MLFCRCFQRSWLVVLIIHASSLNSLIIHQISLINTRRINNIHTQLNMLTIVDPNYSICDIMGACTLISGTLTVFAIKKPEIRFLNSKFLGIFFLLFGFLTVYVKDKTDHVRYAFTDNDSFAIVQSDGSTIKTHPLFGGDYSWSFTHDIVNYRFLPNENIPVFIYLKELKTPIDVRIESAIIIDNLPGQCHLFPVIGNFEQLKEGFVNKKSIEAVGNISIQSDPRLFVKGLLLI